MSKKTDTPTAHETYLIAKDGHKRRITEQKAVIVAAKKAIKMHKLLIKQAKLTSKLKKLEK